MRLVLLAAFLAACAATPSAPGTAGAPPDAAATASRDTRGPTPPAHAIDLSVEALADASIQGPDPVGVVLTGGFGGRALDPVLQIGQARFPDYDHPRPGVLRFLVPDRAALSGGDAALVFPGDDDATVDLTAALREAL